MKSSILLIAAALCFTSCNKMADAIAERANPQTPVNEFVKYTIRNGQHYCDQNAYHTLETSELKFVAKFDSSAIYQTALTDNQYDINKLFGFSDNNKDHHQYSARFGWRWSDGALRLFAYVYNEGVRSEHEMTTVGIGEEVRCSIRVSPQAYIFQANETIHEMPRLSTTEKGKGYQLYPYFGGDETAPHDISIWIRLEKK